MKKELNVLFVSEYWPPKVQGGGELSTSKLAAALVRHGVSVTVLTSHFPNLKKEEIIDGVLVLRRMETGSNPSSFRSNYKRYFQFSGMVKKEITKLLKETKFDVIHYFGVQSSFSEEEIKSKLIIHINSPVPFCPKGTLMLEDAQQCHHRCTMSKFIKCLMHSKEIGKMPNRFYLKYNPIMWWFLYSYYERRLDKLRGYDGYSPNSEFMKFQLIKAGIRKEKIHVVPAIINIEEFKKLKPANNKVPALLCLSSYVENKGVMQLLNALSTIDFKYTCDFYGEGTLKNKMKQFVKKNRLGSKVKIHNKVDYSKIPAIMEKCDILVQPSLVAEAIPRTVLEAMAAGRIVVSSSIGGAQYVIKNKETGILVNPYLIMDLRQGIIDSLMMHANKSEIGKKAVDAVKDYGEETVIRKLLELYNG